MTSTPAPPALLVYSLEQRLDDDPTQESTHLLRFSFGSRFQDPAGSGHSEILINSDPSPGCPPSTEKVPFQIAGDERMIALYSRYFDFVNGRTFLISMKSFLGQIKNLLINEVLDLDWELHGPEFIEHLPGHNRWNSLWTYFTFGMRYITPTVIRFGKPMMVIRDLSPRRCLMASKEERDESDAICKEMIWHWTPYNETSPYPRTILRRVPFPDSIDLRGNILLSIREDSVVVVEHVRH